MAARLSRNPVAGFARPRLADPAFYGAGNGGDSAQLQELLKRQAALQDWIEEAESRWMTLSEQLEGL